MRYRVSDSFSFMEAKGGSGWLSAGVSYPALRSQAVNLYFNGTLDLKRFDDDVAGIKVNSRRIRSLSLGAQGNYAPAGSARFLGYSVAFTGGSLDRGAIASELAADAATRATQGSYGVLRASGNWLEPFGAHFSASATLSTQFASKNLDSSEKIYLGGPRGVRAYPIEEAASDEGQILNLEARWRSAAAPSGGAAWTVFGFFDAGRAVINKNRWTGWNAGNPGLPNQYVLKGAGVGLGLQIGQSAQLEIVGATRIGENPGASATGLNADGRAGKSRLWILGTVLF
jgi:hemolysin activation/secretion protein